MRLFCRCGKRKVWFVQTNGLVDGGTYPEVYGPYYSKDAARRFCNSWEGMYKGFAVFDYRYFKKDADELVNMGEA